MEENKNFENRRDQRSGKNLFIFYKLKSDTPDKSMAITCNISGNGLMFETERDIFKDEIIDLEIYQPFNQCKSIYLSIPVKSKVAWIEKICKNNFHEGENKFKVGMEFIEINKEDRKKIVKYIEKNNSYKRP
ncbi:MAG: PilZ domain-containing protein [bacterium]|nr:PilZ domain-containing protein [bacterium]